MLPINQTQSSIVHLGEPPTVQGGHSQNMNGHPVNSMKTHRCCAQSQEFPGRFHSTLFKRHANTSPVLTRFCNAALIIGGENYPDKMTLPYT